MLMIATALLSYRLVSVAMWSQFTVLCVITRILLFCGNIQLSPGPSMCYPCAMCYRPVHWIQKSFLCDTCHLWSQCICCSVSDFEYLRFQGLDDFSWHCPSCTVKLFQFHICSVLTACGYVSVNSEDTNSELSAYSEKCGGVRIAHLNCQNVLPHQEEIFNLMYDAQTDVMALTETWLDDAITDHKVFPTYWFWCITHSGR